MNKDIIVPDSQETEATTETVETKTFTQEQVNEMITKRVEKINSTVTELTAKLDGYAKAEHKSTLETGFAKLNGSKKRQGDFAKLAGLESGASVEDVVARATEMKESGDYDFLFNKGNSGAIKDADKKIVKPKSTSTVKQGIGWANLFKK